MTETPDMATQPDANAAAPAAGPSIRVLNQYIKDLSFENPGNNVSEQPNIDLSIDVGATARNDDVYEVILKLRARAGTKETALFILELDYAGLFQVSGFGEGDVEPIVLIECPRILFPFARRIIADISAEGGFPPLRVDPVDFGALYNTQKQRAAQAASPAQA